MYREQLNTMYTSNVVEYVNIFKKRTDRVIKLILVVVVCMNIIQLSCKENEPILKNIDIVTIRVVFIFL